MHIMNLGSLNLDKVYEVNHFVRAGETISANSYVQNCGGKGVNQSVALARAGISVFHLGAIGDDGITLRNMLTDAGVNDKYLQILPVDSGHAVIQLNSVGQNCIIVNKGANGLITKQYLDDVFSHFLPGDLLVLQNETSCVDYAIEKASHCGFKVAFNPSPITSKIQTYPLNLVDYFILNELEGKIIAGINSDDYREIIKALHVRFPKAVIVLTVGKSGAYLYAEGQILYHGSYDVPAVDTTAAGDTFCGYFLASVAKGFGYKDALHYASRASGLAVTRKGAADSIPVWEEMLSASLQEK